MERSVVVLVELHGGNAVQSGMVVLSAFLLNAPPRNSHRVQCLSFHKSAQQHCSQRNVLPMLIAPSVPS